MAALALALLLLLRLAAAGPLAAGAAAACAGRAACEARSRRLLFVMDASLSIAPARFDGPMADAAAAVFCAFRDRAGGARYEAGVVTFGRGAAAPVPFQDVGPAAFADLLRDRVVGRTSMSCCSSHAEAAILAREMFQDADAARPGFDNVAIFLTDGVPYMNYFEGRFGVGSDPAASRFYLDRGLPFDSWNASSHLVFTQGGPRNGFDELRVAYGTQTVPLAMRALKDAGVRTVFAGLPREQGTSSDGRDYFAGQTRHHGVCYENRDVDPPETSCGQMQHWPLVSEPVDAHVFSADSWDLEPLVARTVAAVCRSTAKACDSTPRDVVILVDTSESMDAAHFRSEVTELVKHVAASVDMSTGSRVALATFGAANQTRVLLPLQTYSDLATFNATVDEELANSPLKCCTAFAEAFELVRKYLRAAAAPGHDKLVIVISDGTPYQNYGADKWAWNRRGRAPDRCQYATTTIPKLARLLREAGVRLAFAGVPNAEARPPMAEFFDGSLRGERCCVNTVNNRACLIEGERIWCVGNFDFDDRKNTRCEAFEDARLVSDGPKHLLLSDSWNIDGLKMRLADLLCSAATPGVDTRPTGTTHA